MHQRTRLAIDVLASPLGELRIVCTANALCALDYGDCAARMDALLQRRYSAYEVTRTPDPLGITTRLERYFAGELAALDAIATFGGGTLYQERVWAALRTIAPGATRTYGQIAVQLGATHARAVGHANSLNPIAIVVPCHRVIGANATLTGYAGGVERKSWLLDHEARYGGRALSFAHHHPQWRPMRAEGTQCSERS